MTKMQKKINLILEESEIEPTNPADISPENDAELFNDTFEDPEAAGEFRTEPKNAGYIDKYIANAKDWVFKLNEIADWLSGIDGESLTQSLNDIDTDGGPFDGISNENKKISNISEDLLGVSETIKRYILEANRRQSQAPQQDVNM